MTQTLRKWADSALPWLTLVTMALAIFMVFVYVPTDRFQGIVQRIFYFHVPLAMMSFAAFGLVAIASILFLWRGSRFWDRLAHS